MQREATVKYYKLCRAHEEIVRLDMETRRLRTFIHDESILIRSTISSLSTSNPPLATELQRQWQLRKAVNCLHIQRLDDIERLYKPTGSRDIGKRQSTIDPMQTPMTMKDEQLTDDAERVEGDDDEVVQDENHDLEKLTDFVLTLVD